MQGLLLLAVVVLVGACGTVDGPQTATEVTVQGADGPVSIPATDRGIWALDDATAVHLLALGVVPEHAARNRYQGDRLVTANNTILAEAGVPLAEPEQVELIAAAEPALIIGPNFPGHREMLASLERIAPVLLIDDNRPWDEQIRILATATGRSEAGDALVDRLRARIQRTADRIASSEFAGAVVSVLSACGSQYCVYGGVRTFGALLTELGFRRPPTQLGPGDGWGYTATSAEFLDRESGDVIFALSGTVGRGGASPLTSPLLNTATARTAEVDFAAWYGSGALNVVWILHDIEAVLFGGRIADASVAPRLWAEVTG